MGSSESSNDVPKKYNLSVKITDTETGEEITVNQNQVAVRTPQDRPHFFEIPLPNLWFKSEKSNDEVTAVYHVESETEDYRSSRYECLTFKKMKN